MRRIMFAAFLLVLAIGYTSNIFAHPGGTDGSGGHWDRSTGEYHYHHGYGPHDHYDMDGDGDVDCPYNFDDNISGANRSSSGSTTDSSNHVSSESSSAQIGSARREERSDETEIPAPVVDNQASSKSSINWFGICMLSVIFLLILFFIIRSVYLRRREKKINDITGQRFDDVLKTQESSSIEILTNILANEYQSLLTRQQRIQKLQPYLITDPLEIVQIPSDTYLDESGLPHIVSISDEKDDPYTFDLSSSNVYHKTTCRHSWGGKINALRLQNLIDTQPGWRSKQIRPCMHCKPQLPDLTWLKNYNSILAIISLIDQICKSAPCEDMHFVADTPYYDDFITCMSVAFKDSSQEAIQAACLLDWKAVEKLLKHYGKKNDSESSIVLENLKYIKRYHWNLELKCKEQIRQEVETTL